MSANSKPTKQFCKKQIGRLSCFASTFPRTDDGILELVSTLWGVAHTEDHATRTVDALCKSSQFCPTPAEIRAAAEQQPLHEAMPGGCKICNGSEWVIDEANNGVRRCTCERGQYLRAKDRERAA